MRVRQGDQPALVTRDQRPRVLGTPTGTEGPVRAGSAPRPARRAFHQDNGIRSSPPHHRGEGRGSPLRGEAEGQHGRGAPHGRPRSGPPPTDHRPPTPDPARIRCVDGPCSLDFQAFSRHRWRASSARCLTERSTPGLGEAQEGALRCSPLSGPARQRHISSGACWPPWSCSCALATLVVQSPAAQADTRPSAARVLRHARRLDAGLRHASATAPCGSGTPASPGPTSRRRPASTTGPASTPTSAAAQAARGRGHPRPGHDAVVLRAGVDRCRRPT